MKLFYFTCAILALTATSYATSPAHDGCSASAGQTAMNSASADLVDTAISAGSFKTLAAALQAADLVSTLKGKGPFTVFAPTDEAFAKLPKGTLDELLKPSNKAKLSAILLHHVVPGNVMAADVVKLHFANTAGGQRLSISAAEGDVRVDGVRVIKTDVRASNGVIHVIDAVMMPAMATIVEVAEQAGSFNTLLKALTAADLSRVLGGEGPYTVFAPSDAAFEKLAAGTVQSLLEPENRAQLTTLLQNHVVKGRVYADQVSALQSVQALGGAKLSVQANNDAVLIGGCRVVKTDIEASNGVIHVIDTVILAK